MCFFGAISARDSLTGLSRRPRYKANPSPSRVRSIPWSGRGDHAGDRLSANINAAEGHTAHPLPGDGLNWGFGDSPPPDLRQDERSIGTWPPMCYVATCEVGPTWNRIAYAENSIANLSA